MPHIPLYVPDEIRDPDPKRAYINVIEHMDDQVGRITKKLKELGLDKNTIVIYTTDNGPWLPFKHHGGSAGELRDGKGSTFEGGQRVPCVMWAPGLIPAGTETNELMTTIDLLPSLAALSSSTLPGKNKIDGIDQSALITGKAERSARNEFIYYSRSGDLEGLRQGKWKLLVKGPKKSKKSKKSTKEAKVTIYLFDLEADVAEQNNLADQNPELVAKLKTRMEELDQEIEANARPVWRKVK